MWGKNVIKDLEGRILSYTTVGKFLSGLKKSLVKEMIKQWR